MAELFSSYRNDVQHITIVLLFLATLRWGAGPERLTAGALLYLTVADRLYHAVFGPGVSLMHLDIGHFANDLVAAIVMVGTALFANRMYCLWIGALQLIAVLSHFARGMSEAISPLAYAIMFIAPSYLQIAIIAGGLVAHHRREKTVGMYRSWRGSSPLSPE